MKSTTRTAARGQDLINQVTESAWEYADSDTQELTHNIHRYSGKFIPQVASRAIELLTREGELVVDPYCGSGTTLLQAALLNRSAVGIDLSPLAVLIGCVKTTPLPATELSALKSYLETVLAPDYSPLFADPRKRPTAVADARRLDPWYQKWYQPVVLDDLIAIELAIRSISSLTKRNVALVAFSDILRRSSNAHSGYPNVMFNRNAPTRISPISDFLRTLRKVCEKVGHLSNASARWDQVAVARADASRLPLASESADAVVTHPPYIGSIPYAEYGLLSLKWLGTEPRELDRLLTGGRRQSRDVIARFEEAYSQMLCEVARVLKPRRHAFLMVGNPVVRGEVVDLAEMTIVLAKHAGLSMVVRTERAGVNRRANKMGAEHLLFFRRSATVR